jgi:hypothetical protein
MNQTGLADVRNMNLISIPGESPINLRTISATYQSVSGNVVSAAGNVITYGSATNNPVAGMAVVFAGGSLPTGISAGTQSAAADTNVYWIGSVNIGATTFQIYSDPFLANVVTLSSSGTGTFATINMVKPTDGCISHANDDYMIDANGRAWTRHSSFSTYRFLGNLTRTNASGNGIGTYYTSPSTFGGTDNDEYLFVFRNSLIDYLKISNSASTWVYGWNRATGGSGQTGSALLTPAGVGNPHRNLIGQDNVFYFTDAYSVGSFTENAPGVSTPVKFDPSTTSTYTTSSQASPALLIPRTDLAQCLTELGVNLLVGGQYNKIYPWNRTATTFSYPIFLPEKNVARMVTVNTVAYIFPGNRGRIYLTNGTNSQLFVKVPDHLSGAPEPIYTWQCAGFNKNQLYFSFSLQDAQQNTLTTTGGLWGVDVDTKCLRLVNRLSYGTYAGYASVFIANQTTVGGSAAADIGWFDGVSGNGMDMSDTVPYQNYEPYIDSDMLPLGLRNTPYTPSQVEFKLTTPLVAGEKVKISYRTNITGSFTQIGETTTTGVLSDVYKGNFQNAQWVQLRIQTSGVASNGSYVRLREFRVRP